MASFVAVVGFFAAITAASVVAIGVARLFTKRTRTVASSEATIK